MRLKGLNNYFFQFIFITVVNFGLGGFLLLLPHLYSPVNQPEIGLGAPADFIMYDNLLESFLAIVIIHFFRKVNLNIPSFLRYLLLAFLLYIGKGLFLFFYDLQKDQPALLINTVYISMGALLFRLNLIWAGLLLYFLLEKEQLFIRQKTMKDLEISKIKAAASQAELQALQAKINPHFFYNVLNSISQAIDIAPEKAKKMIGMTSDFFRYNTMANPPFLWTLAEEMELINTYLSIENLRFGDRIIFDLPQNSDDYADLPIPRFLLQPIVENAVKHALSKKMSTGHLTILLEENPGYFSIQILDDGLPFNQQLKLGYGLGSINQKLALIECPPLEIIQDNERKGVKIKLLKHADIYRNYCRR